MGFLGGDAQGNCMNVEPCVPCLKGGKGKVYIAVPAYVPRPVGSSIEANKVPVTKPYLIIACLRSQIIYMEQPSKVPGAEGELRLHVFAQMEEDSQNTKRNLKPPCPNQIRSPVGRRSTPCISLEREDT
eukprot:1141299-Pelagomonas_calceolata.AAC.2